MTTYKELTPREEKIVTSLIAGNSKAQTARDVGVAETTVYYTIQRPHDKARMAFLREETEMKRQAAIDKYNDTVFQALQILQDVMTTADKDADKIKAAKIFLDKAPMMQQALEIKVTKSPINELAKELANKDLSTNDKPFESMKDLEDAIDNGEIIPEGEEHEEISDTE